MSKYSKVINNFIDGSLTPEIDSLNLKLCSMEELGYDNAKLLAYRTRVNNLLPIFDFLSEYADGNEEADWSDLQLLISITGLSVLSPISAQTIVESSSSSSENISDSSTAELLRVYVNDVLHDGSLIASGSKTILFMGYTDITAIVVDGISQEGPAYRLINAVVPAGINSYNVSLIRDNDVVLNKTITIQAI